MWGEYMSGEILEKIPYTIPYFENLLRAVERSPARYYKRLNAVVDFFEFSCNGNLIMYVQTLLPALGELVLGLLETDVDDVVRGMLRPVGPSGRKSMVFSPLKAKWQWEIPELGEEIGKRIPGAKFIKASKWWGKTRALWIIDGVIQRALYVWLIIDLVTEFLYNWSTGILKHPACYGEGWLCRGGFFGDAGYSGWHSLPLCGIYSEQYGRLPDGVEVVGNEIITSRPLAVLISYTLVPIFGTECQARWRLMVTRQDGAIIDVSPWASTWSRDERTAMMVARLPGPGRYYVGGWIDWTSCYTIGWGLDIVSIKA